MLSILPVVAFAADPVRTEVYRVVDGVEPALTSLDVYPAEGAAPVVVFVHGGSWRSGDKGNLARSSIVPWLQRRGYAVVAINHRLIDDPRSPGTSWVDQISDVQAALGWVSAHAAELGGDRHRIGLIGYSSGAHLVSLAAMTSAVPLDGVVALDVSAYDVPRAIEEACGLGWCVGERNLTATFGVDVEGQRAASPVHQVHAGAPPFLVVSALDNGGHEQALSKVQSDYLVEALRGVNVRATHHHGADESHASLVSDLGRPGDGVTAAVDRFFDEIWPGR